MTAYHYQMAVIGIIGGIALVCLAVALKMLGAKLVDQWIERRATAKREESGASLDGYFNFSPFVEPMHIPADAAQSRRERQQFHVPTCFRDMKGVSR